MLSDQELAEAAEWIRADPRAQLVVIAMEQCERARIVLARTRASCEAARLTRGKAQRLREDARLCRLVR